MAREFLDRGLLIRPLGNVVYFMPPYAITDAEAAWALDEIGAVLPRPRQALSGAAGCPRKTYNCGGSVSQAR